MDLRHVRVPARPLDDPAGELFAAEGLGLLIARCVQRLGQPGGQLRGQRIGLARGKTLSENCQHCGLALVA
jgi:hypothetical protein